MRLVHAVSDVIFSWRTLRALAIASVVFGTARESAGAPWELRIEIPGATFLHVQDVSSNRRFVVGSYCGPGTCSNFFWDRGDLTTVSIPGAQDTYLTGVNAAGDILGNTWSPDAGELAFLRGRDGTITPMSCPFAALVRPAAMNDAGTVVGVAFTGSEDSSDGFRWQGGRCERLPISGGDIFPADISANGIVVGTAGSTHELTPFYAFLIRRDEVIPVEHPEAPFGVGGITALSAVAPNGLALGWWSPDVAGVIHGNINWFVFRDGVFEPVDPPGDPRELTQLSISSSGLITYAESDGVVRSIRVTRALVDQ